MKKRTPIILMCIITVLCLFAFACDCTGRKRVDTLFAPVVTLNGNVASWGENAMAQGFEVSVDGEIQTVSRISTSYVLEDGQMLKVRAIGDGKIFKTSEWSNAVRYLAGASSSTASSKSEVISQVSQSSTEQVNTSTSEQLSASISTSSVQSSIEQSSCSSVSTQNPTSSGSAVVEDAVPVFTGFYLRLQAPGEGAPSLPGPTFTPEMQLIKQYYQNEENIAGETLPTQAEACDVYVQAGQTVYFCVSFKCEKEFEIASFKINGQEYDSSDFSLLTEVVDEEIYKTLWITQTAFEQAGIKEYSVSDIKYQSLTSQKEVSYESDRTSAKLAVSYSVDDLTFGYGGFNATYFNNNVSGSAMVQDAKGIVAACGGWLRAVIIDNATNEIITHKPFTVNSMSGIGANGLTFGNTYRVVLYLYADLLDGNGVWVHVLEQKDVFLHAIRYNSIGGGYGKDENGKNCATFDVEITKLTAEVELRKFELYKGDELVYENDSFSGVDSLNVLNNTTYLARVHYYDPLCGENYVDYEYTTVELYQELSVFVEGSYTFNDDAIFVMTLGGEEYSPNIEELTFKLWEDDESLATTISMGANLFYKQGFTYLVVKDFLTSVTLSGTANCSATALIDLNDGSSPISIDCAFNDTGDYVSTFTSEGSFDSGSVDFHLTETADGEYTVTPEIYHNNMGGGQPINFVEYEVVLEKDGTKVESLYTSPVLTWPVDEDAWVQNFVNLLKTDIVMPSDHNQVVDDMGEMYLSNLIWLLNFNNEDGNVVTDARDKERELIKNISQIIPYDKDENIVVTEILDFILSYDYDGYMQEIISDGMTDREKLNALIDGIYDGDVMGVLSDVVYNLLIIDYYHNDIDSYDKYFDLIDGAYLDGTLNLYEDSFEEEYIKYMRSKLSIAEVYVNGTLSEHTVTVDKSSLDSGEYYVVLYYRLAGVDYEEGEYEGVVYSDYSFIV